MRLFVQLDQRFGTNAKLGQVGLVGLVVLLQLDVEAHIAGDGTVSSSRASPGQLACALAAFRIDPADISAALNQLNSIGLISLDEDGSVHLLKWHEWSGRPLTDAERAARHRAKAKDASRNVTEPVTRHDANVTQRDASRPSRRRVEKSERREHPPTHSSGRTLTPRASDARASTANPGSGPGAEQSGVVGGDALQLEAEQRQTEPKRIRTLEEDLAEADRSWMRKVYGAEEIP